MKSDIARLDPLIALGKYLFLKRDKEPSPDIYRGLEDGRKTKKLFIKC
ncbi:unnamed protein product [marine sediment metagenome]|uniref:Uncharacterized protein n=1 Tax=marine sediment metagenome TaxID=412755 RepID=X1L8D1_9ZZZZ